jgi:Sulfotransferase family
MSGAPADDVAVRPADERDGPQAPVIVLAYAQSGAARLQRLLRDTGTLACTTSTGVLPAGDQAAAAWRRIDDRERLSPLALASVRSLVSGMMAAILAQAGRSRWCETAFVDPDCAGTFLRAYPGARFVCLHRSCPEVIRAAISAHPWGLADTPFARHARAYPASASAAIAAYWAFVTESLLRFEAAHPQACLRVRYEDLAGRPGTAGQILDFLGLEPDAAAGIPVVPWREEEAAVPAQVPASQIPPPLLKDVDELMSRLGYPPAAWDEQAVGAG